MKLVIDIPDDYMNYIDNYEKGSLFDIALINAIKNGTPLPKGHGRMIDAEELKKIIKENHPLTIAGYRVKLDDIDNASTIIEADKENEG